MSVANGPLLGTDFCNDQLDGDRDGYGNPCDTDLNNNGATDLVDVSLAFAAQQSVSTDPNFDISCNGAADLIDLGKVFAGAVLVSVPGPSGLPCTGTIGCFDTDQDGAFDFEDNCSEVPNGPVVGTDACFDQEDGDLDGYGNACDTDIKNNGATDLLDWVATMNAVATVSLDPVFDFNCNGAADLLDGVRADLDQQVVKVVGPSGLDCAGTIPCTAP